MLRDINDQSLLTPVILMFDVVLPLSVCMCLLVFLLVLRISHQGLVCAKHVLLQSYTRPSLTRVGA